MADEEQFDRALNLAGNFNNVGLRILLRHPDLPIGSYIEVDNLAQKGRTVFVFEGKFNKEELAVKQLQVRFKSLLRFKDEYVRAGMLNSYSYTRLFYYSFKRKVLTEFNQAGNKIKSVKFTDIKNLAEILQKL